MINQSENYIIRMAINQDAESCANIHKQEINTGFLSQLGIKFLKLLYKAIILSPNSCCFVAENNDFDILGFVAVSFNTAKFYKEFFLKYGLHVSFILMLNLFKPKIMKKVLESATYPFKRKKSEQNKNPINVETELLSIAVKPNAKGTGISQKLVEAMFDECRKRNIKEIKVTVGEENVRAKKFYEKMGFVLFSNISVHESEVSNMYIKKLN